MTGDEKRIFTTMLNENDFGLGENNLLNQLQRQIHQRKVMLPVCVKIRLLQFFGTMEKNFYECGIFKLPKKMAKGCGTKLSIYN